MKSFSTFEELYRTQSEAIRSRFAASGEGRAAAFDRSSLLDSVVQELYREFISPELSAPYDFCLVALGGYGREELFPHSDIDLLFLSENKRVQSGLQEAIAAVSRALWDLHLRVGPASRTIADCGALDRSNLEFSISLLDSRYLAGDALLFARLRDQVIPHLIARDRPDLVRDLVEMARRRHAKYGETIFHLEPNVKEAPGGLRDYHVARWLTLISELESQRHWVKVEEAWPARLGDEGRRAFEFLSTVRCLLHYEHGRDDNQLTYELQEQAAGEGIGLDPRRAIRPEDWMRHYFRHARAILRLAENIIRETLPARSSLFDLYQDWRSRVANADFSVVRGRVYFRQPAEAQDPFTLVSLFEFISRHGLEISREAEHLVEEAVPRIEEQARAGAGLWKSFCRVLAGQHAAAALRVMHRLGLLDALFPEFRVIDSLVIRDFYHRYTVDEHSFRTIENLRALRRADEEWARSFGGILAELDKPELLFLALLFHDVGKGMPGEDHVEGSLQAVGHVLSRLDVEPQECESIRFLIRNHLEMSATMLRRDIFDPATVHAFAEKVGTHERLKMLCLLTYADVKSVNPEALKPWKAEMLWQLYVATSNALTRSLDEDRVRVEEDGASKVARIASVAGLPEKEFNVFLDGFPRRYLETHTTQEMVLHFAMARTLTERPVALEMKDQRHFWELTILAQDRPRLFASLTGALAAWGMNIVKADAFANRAGTVLDTFRSIDLHRTLDLNPTEIERFKQDLVNVVCGKEKVETLMRGRVQPRGDPRSKITIPTQVNFDNEASSHSTLLELIARDRPGLLYKVSSILADHACNIEIALIDTEGEKVIDVFYLTAAGAKLDPERQAVLGAALLEKI